MDLFPFDDAYLQRLRERDFQTEQHFVAYFSQLILIKARARLHSPQAVDDIRQETFLRVLKALRTEGAIRQPDRLGPYVNSVCNNVLQEFYRSSARAVPLDDQVADSAGAVLDLDGLLITRQTREQVLKVLERLSAKDRQLLRRVFLEEKDKDEVCREFGVDRDYLRVLLHRAKQSFRDFYLQAEGLAGDAPEP